MAPSRQVSDREPSAPVRRLSARDLIALLLVLGWGALGIVKVAHDVANYRAQQASIAAFSAEHARLSGVMTGAAVGAPVAGAPYDPALGKWLMGEAFGYLVTLAVVAVGSYRAGRRRASVQVKWIAPIRQQTVSGAAWGHQRAASAQSGSVAAERLSVVVWTDRVVKLEKERA